MPTGLHFSDDFLILIRHVFSHDQHADVLEKAQEKGVFSILPIDFLGYQLGGYSPYERVFGELNVVE
jgi:hypothetical protein